MIQGKLMIFRSGRRLRVPDWSDSQLLNASTAVWRTQMSVKTPVKITVSTWRSRRRISRSVPEKAECGVYPSKNSWIRFVLPIKNLPDVQITSAGPNDIMRWEELAFGWSGSSTSCRINGRYGSLVKANWVTWAIVSEMKLVQEHSAVSTPSSAWNRQYSEWNQALVISNPLS